MTTDNPNPTDGDCAEWVGYINGLVRAGNLRPRIPYGDEGGRVLNDIRAQIDAEIEKAKTNVQS